MKIMPISTRQSSIWLLFPGVFSLFSCVQKTDPSEVPHEEIPMQEVELSPAQQTAIGLQLDTITHRNLSTALKANGKLEVPPQNKAQVNTLTGGIVTSILIREGEFVRSGQVLATLENLEFLQLQQEFLEAQANLPYLKGEFERQRELQKDNINAAKSAQLAEANYMSKLAAYKGMYERLILFNINPDQLKPENLQGTFSVRAPISGHITRIAISIGQYIDPHLAIFEIVDTRFLHIDLTIFEPDIHKIHEGQQLTFSDANDPKHFHTAEIFSINKAFEKNQQAVIAHAKIIHETETLLPGMFIEARINIDQTFTSALPDEAIVSNGDEHFIYIAAADHHFRQIQVRTGASDMGFTEIFPLEPIVPGQQVVIDGAYYLFSQLTKGEGEHHH